MRDCIVDGCDEKAEKGVYYIAFAKPNEPLPTRKAWFICKYCLQSLSLSSEHTASHLEQIMIARAVERELKQ